MRANSSARLNCMKHDKSEVAEGMQECAKHDKSEIAEGMQEV